MENNEIKEKIQNILQKFGYNLNDEIPFMTFNKILKGILGCGNDNPYVIKRSESKKNLYGYNRISLYEEIPLICKKCKQDISIYPIEMLNTAIEYGTFCPECASNIESSKNDQILEYLDSKEISIKEIKEEKQKEDGENSNFIDKHNRKSKEGGVKLILESSHREFRSKGEVEDSMRNLDSGIYQTSSSNNSNSSKSAISMKKSKRINLKNEN